MTHRRLVVPAVLLLVLGLSACASGPPLSLGEGYESCNSEIDEPVTFGDVARASAAGTVVMESIELEGAKGLALREIYLVPIQNQVSLGADAFPPAAEFWDRRITVPGTAISPGEEMTVLFVVEAVGGGDIHRSEGYTARYSIDGRPYETTSSAQFRLAPDCGAEDEDGP
ncbi:hypothetical protein SAMN05216488_0385 [Microbacterium sp. LKL04]|uniref:hypothetical protein n=1 Tax=Microbacterium sp. LKL04 TaxID=912630 RepID=UPI000875E3C6|nr:hypothetical protein [Microbacterium sp. LKL04]SCY03468.1 hypothetical protein SAMN05216488_0385 [Microbacterium sp. LKL04]